MQNLLNILRMNKNGSYTVHRQQTLNCWFLYSIQLSVILGHCTLNWRAAMFTPSYIVQHIMAFNVWRQMELGKRWWTFKVILQFLLRTYKAYLACLTELLQMLAPFSTCRGQCGIYCSCSRTIFMPESQVYAITHEVFGESLSPAICNLLADACAVKADPGDSWKRCDIDGLEYDIIYYLTELIYQRKKGSCWRAYWVLNWSQLQLQSACGNFGALHNLHRKIYMRLSPCAKYRNGQ